jgi:hypothetical protein
MDRDAAPWHSWIMPAPWRGRIRPDESGNIPVEGFNRFLSEHPRIARSPVRATIEFVRLQDPSGVATIIRARASAPESPDRVRVTLTEDDLPDDSIRSIRYVLRFRRDGRRWRLQAAQRTQRCQRGRGHQNFSPRPCR